MEILRVDLGILEWESQTIRKPATDGPLSSSVKGVVLAVISLSDVDLTCVRQLPVPTPGVRLKNLDSEGSSLAN